MLLLRHAEYSPLERRHYARGYIARERSGHAARDTYRTIYAAGLQSEVANALYCRRPPVSNAAAVADALSLMP